MRLRTGGGRPSDRGDRTPVAIVAPHGGHIEPRTSEIAAAIAGEVFSLLFIRRAESGRHHRELHLTSDRFDEPRALALAEACKILLGVHGRADDGDGDNVWLGGLDLLDVTGSSPR
ncbi:poly-gamma-glutamate hydrolase family protein (plasmid) [Rhizobium ruizarguesonis]|uniref:Poly-gamma-glutamate hydrolase family protein n=1 Tax=Rhizobium ruizarguesonis TaxID=2081791 RepID=A0ACD5EX86_9HYPH|nr:poly-gamma-glutamate hydrolase family protein [Rhizobium leguminosarum]